MTKTGILFALALLVAACNGSDDGAEAPAQPADVAADTPSPENDASAADAAPEDTTAAETAQPACTPLEKFCKGQDVFICKADGIDFGFVKTCPSGDECKGGECVCKPQCEGPKECGPDGCGGSCGQCPASHECQPDGSCKCVPSCAGKECGDDGCGGPCGGCPDEIQCSPNGKCGCVATCAGKECGEDGCGGSCGGCAAGVECSPNGKCGCTPACAGLTCGFDGCGDLCNGCLDLSFDDGSTETAYGYSVEPSTKPKKLACLVRYELPFTNMRLLRFTAGWMYGLYALKVPFRLVYVPAEKLKCTAGGADDWFLEYCEGSADGLVEVAELLPKEPYVPMEKEELGAEVVLPSKSVFIGALFDLSKGGGPCTTAADCPAGYHCDCGDADPCPEGGGTCGAYPVYACPVDESGQGAASFMMPVYEKPGGPAGTLVMEGGPFQDKETNQGAIAFGLRVQKTGESKP